jgi:putative DNA methylase
MAVVPYSLKDAPALIERLLPVQKISAESYKEQMAGSGKTLTALGSYWKGRKPLILAKACVLGCLLPATNNPVKDLQIFELLMGMDDHSLQQRLGLNNENLMARDGLIQRAKSMLSVKELAIYCNSEGIPSSPYRLIIAAAKRPEENDLIFDNIWTDINSHLKTTAKSFPELIEQLGIMRFGHRPIVGDSFCGSGQIPFEAARLGCHVYAADLNPIACMLTWGAINIVGGTKENRERISTQQQELARFVEHEVSRLGIEDDGNGWNAKVFLYCLEVRCPQTGWRVPLLPSRVISNPRSGTKNFVIAELIPDPIAKRYDISIKSNVTKEEFDAATHGTVVRDSRFSDAFLLHKVDGIEYKTKISTLRGDFQKPDGTTDNRVRHWEREEIKPDSKDIFQERLYCIQWIRPKKSGKGEDYEFRSITHNDLEREKIVQKYLETHLDEWQQLGWLPDMQIEPGGPPRYEGLNLLKGRGWIYWHQVFNPRQLLIAGLLNSKKNAELKFGVTQVINWNSKLSSWNPGSGGGGSVAQTFYNQALNTLFNYGCRSVTNATPLLTQSMFWFPIKDGIKTEIRCIIAQDTSAKCDLFITDPPYGNAVKYEEILDFFIAWLRKNPPKEFADWTWDSRRALAIKGEGEDFRRGMVSAYTRMTECLPDNGMQVIMFTHQGGPIWADMANIVWASGLQVTAAWYVVTETESALREGNYPKGTVLLVCRKRTGANKTTRDDLGWDIKEEVEKQVKDLIGLNQNAKELYHDENVFEDADIQMAGYAAALRVLTKYAIIDGRDMAAEAIRPRVKGEVTFVDELITYAVETANGCLVPQGIEKRYWDKLSGAERFYLKMIDMESRGAKKLDNYQNFMKAFKVRNFKPLMASTKANNAMLNSAVEFGRNEMGEGSELHNSVMRAVLYAMMELVNGMDSNEVLAHLTFNVPNYYGDITQRELAVSISEYLAKHLEAIRPEEASAARILRELIKNQRM